MKIRSSERTVDMKHNLSIRVSKKPRMGGIVACQSMTIREKLLRLLLGSPHKVTIFVPGDSVDTVSITEVADGGGKE